MAFGLVVWLGCCVSGTGQVGPAPELVQPAHWQFTDRLLRDMNGRFTCRHSAARSDCEPVERLHWSALHALLAGKARFTFTSPQFF